MKTKFERKTNRSRHDPHTPIGWWFSFDDNEIIIPFFYLSTRSRAARLRFLCCDFMVCPMMSAQRSLPSFNDHDDDHYSFYRLRVKNWIKIVYENNYARRVHCAPWTDTPTGGIYLPFCWRSFYRAAPATMVEQLAMADSMDLRNRDNWFSLRSLSCCCCSYRLHHYWTVRVMTARCRRIHTHARASNKNGKNEEK